MVEVTGIKDGVFITLPEVCFATEAEAAAYAARIGATPEGDTRSAGGGTVGTHYTATDYNGSSITIAGTSCIGGVWKPTGSWNDNLESSRHLCGGAPTTFYDSSTCNGGSYPIQGQRSSLGSMNNRASCVRYG